MKTAQNENRKTFKTIALFAALSALVVVRYELGLTVTAKRGTLFSLITGAHETTSSRMRHSHTAFACIRSTDFRAKEKLLAVYKEKKVSKSCGGGKASLV